MSLQRILDAFSAFIDLVSETLAAALASLKRGQKVRVEEADEAGAFHLVGAPLGPNAPFRLDGAAVPPTLGSALKGRDVELVLSPARFLVQPLELPRAAGDFLAGIVRAQIDRLTPWSAQAAAYGWTEPVEGEGERIGLKVVATPRAHVAPLADALKGLGARAVVVMTQADGARVRVLDDSSGRNGQGARIRQVLLAVLGAAAVAATLAVSVGNYFAADLDAELESLDGRIATQRRILLAARDGTGAQGAALRTLERLKRDEASTVLVLDALSDALPDGTYLTQLEIDDGKVGLTGISREASALIALLERSRRFSQATFSAPTTRAEGADGERFQIDARIALPWEAAR